MAQLLGSSLLPGFWTATLALQQSLAHSSASALRYTLLCPVAHYAIAQKTKKPTTKPSDKKKKIKVKPVTADMGDVRLHQAINMLFPKEFKQIEESPEELLDAKLRIEKYVLAKKQQKEEWAADMQMKYQLQMAAINALPPALKAKALQIDNTPFPPRRNFYFDTPPKAYADELIEKS